MTRYVNRLAEAMNILAARGAIFLGQAIAYPGTGMSSSLANVPRDQLIELPVMENSQLGMSTGLSIADPSRPIVSIFPRINFLLEAMGQLSLHLDCIPRFSDYRPRVIIRSAIATHIPLDPGPQHLSGSQGVGDVCAALQQMLRSTRVERILRAEDAVPAYRRAADHDGSTLIIEYTELYDTE